MKSVSFKKFTTEVKNATDPEALNKIKRELSKELFDLNFRRFEGGYKEVDEAYKTVYFRIAELQQQEDASNASE